MWRRLGLIGLVGLVASLLAGCDLDSRPPPFLDRPVPSYTAPSSVPLVVRPTAEPLVFTAGRSAPCGGDCPASYPVKGNRDSGIYHGPGGASYVRTIPEDCYATEGAAGEAGYRPAQW